MKGEKQAENMVKDPKDVLEAAGESREAIEQTKGTKERRQD
jgi:hypothetical protein